MQKLHGKKLYSPTTLKTNLGIIRKMLDIFEHTKVMHISKKRSRLKLGLIYFWLSRHQHQDLSGATEVNS